MSSVYISEPATSGKVVLETTAGDIEIELWSKETPKACRNFIQLCLEGYYDNTIFHRVSPGWIVQGGDPTGTGNGGESIYGAPFADEFHSRLRFSRRGMLAMASTGPNENGSQFFITLTATPELQKKHTLFGSVVGDSVFNALKLGEGDVDKETERPAHPKRIKQVRVLDNPFADIVPRDVSRSEQLQDTQSKPKARKAKMVKNKHLLSFADDDGDEIVQPAKGKSSHDLLDSDPMLSKSAAPLPKTSGQPSSDTRVQVDLVPALPLAARPASPSLSGKKTSDIESKIRAAEQDIQKLDSKKSKRMSAEKSAKATGGSGQQPKTRIGALSMSKKTKQSRKKASESELLARLNAFQDRIRSTKKTADESTSWLAHSLKFKSEDSPDQA
ncbi:Peptidyl-prolyl isomerase cwc27 [Coemansia sp. RSA 2611]|nr:Peptidyl-prolyl isomerase cwc27 [Coemansia sp. RSA 2611]KAJ2717997.1 Peptidyl-prolyl isomerase cwc27 [Coemansia sp. Cherry 401B]